MKSVPQDSLPLIRYKAKLHTQPQTTQSSFNDAWYQPTTTSPPSPDNHAAMVAFGNIPTADGAKPDHLFGISIATQSTKCDVDLRPEKEIPDFDEVQTYPSTTFNTGDALMGDDYLFQGGLPPVLLQFYPSITTQTSSTDFLMAQQAVERRKTVDDGSSCSKMVDVASDSCDVKQKVPRSNLCENPKQRKMDEDSSCSLEVKTRNFEEEQELDPNERSSLSKQVTIAEQNESHHSNVLNIDGEDPDDINTGFLDVGVGSTSKQKSMEDYRKQKMSTATMETEEESIAAKLKKSPHRSSIAYDKRDKRPSLIDDSFMKKLDQKIIRLSVTPSMDHQINKFVSEGEMFRHPEKKTKEEQKQTGIDLTNVAQYELAEEIEDEGDPESSDVQNLSKSNLPRPSVTYRRDSQN